MTVARPTARGIALLAAAAATYIAARMLGTWELYLLAVGFTATVLVAWLAVAVTARRLEGSRTVTPPRPVAGDPVSVSVRLSNGSLLPGPQITLAGVAAGLSGDAGELQVESLGPRARRAVSPPPRPARRGVHRLPALRARAEDPLGLAHAERRLGDEVEVVVYPRLVSLPSCALFPGMGARRERGLQGLSTLGASEFRGVRPHNPGEPLNHIDWKSTAKTGTLMLREMDDPASGDVTVLLDGSSALVAGEPPDDQSRARRAGRRVDRRLRPARRPRREPAPAAGRVAPHAARAGRGRARPSARGARPGRAALDGAASGRRSTPCSRAPRAAGGRGPWRSSSLGLDAELVETLVGLRARGLQVSVVHVEAASFAVAGDVAAAAHGGGGARPGAPPADDDAARLRAALAASGVRCVTLRRGDDLRAALSLGPAEARRAEPARALRR